MTAFLAPPARRPAVARIGVLVAVGAIVASYLAWSLGSSGQFLPHAYCLTFQPGLLALHGISDALIALAYFSIPLTLITFMRRRPDVPMRWMFGLFGLFIVACGLTHVMNLATLWWPAYWLDGSIKALTAAASVPTAVAMWFVLPQVLKIPGNDELRLRRDALAAEVAERKRAEQALRGAQAELELRVAERTEQLARTTRELQHANAVLDTLIECAPVGLGLWGRDLRYQRLNSALAQINGLPAEAHIGRTVEEVLPQFDSDVPRALREVARSGRAQRNLEISGSTPAAPGRIRHWRASFYPVNVGDERVGVGAVIEEVTAQREDAVERERLLEAERAARAEAERANRLKDDLLASVSHELRTPLSAIMSGAYLLQVPTLAPAQARGAIEVIARNARAQARLIDDLLDVARIVAGQLKLELAPVELRSLIERTVQSLEPQAQAKQIRLELLLPENPLLVAGDAGRLAQVLSNLVGNAIKFSPKAASVRVSARADDARVEIVVQDAGEGIAAEFLPQLFEPFQQGSGDPLRRRAGLGLGLSIARRLTEMHGGALQAVSDGLGRGSTFTVHLPLRAVAAPLAPDAALAQPADLTGVRVLMVDDEEELLQIQAAALRTSGAVVATALSGEAALDELARDQTDVLVSDLGMPGLDGFAMMQRWRQFEREQRRPPLPALALSGYARVQDSVRAKEAGFQAHLAKPVDSTALALAIGRVLQETRASAQAGRVGVVA